MAAWERLPLVRLDGQVALAGLRPAQAVAAVLIYRLVNAKSAVTAVLFVHGSIRQLRERPAA
ncbi:MAG TPA: hypothetical protein VEF71_02895 [Streptosporangiaceae bacterium]|nr:hypothetical protein [Streptosporangiaceae bacterium]